MAQERARLSFTRTGLLLVPLMLLASAVSAQVMPEIRNKACIQGDCENGSGVMELRNEFGRGKYEGQFRNGEFDGYGRLELPASDIARATYLGNWSQGKRHGRGTYWNGKGTLYMGQWQNDLRHGVGTYVINLPRWTDNLYSEYWLKENTENYSGEFRDDHYHGQGTYRWANGSKFEGGFFANKKHGPGTFYYETGTARKQLWEFGEWIQ